MKQMATMIFCSWELLIKLQVVLRLDT